MWLWIVLSLWDTLARTNSFPSQKILIWPHCGLRKHLYKRIYYNHVSAGQLCQYNECILTRRKMQVRETEMHIGISRCLRAGKRVRNELMPTVWISVIRVFEMPDKQSLRQAAQSQATDWQPVLSVPSSGHFSIPEWCGAALKHPSISHISFSLWINTMLYRREERSVILGSLLLAA